MAGLAPLVLKCGPLAPVARKGAGRRMLSRTITGLLKEGCQSEVGHRFELGSRLEESVRNGI